MYKSKLPFKPGDIVRIKDLEDHSPPAVPEMKIYNNKVVTISNVSTVNHRTGYITYCTNWPVGFIWHYSSFELVSKKVKNKNNKRSPLKEGDKVIVYRKTKWDGWTIDMVESIGKTFTIERRFSSKEKQLVNFKENPYNYPFSCIKRA